MQRNRLALWVWALPLVFLLHDGEEILTMLPFLRTQAQRLPAPVRAVAATSTAQFGLSVLIIFSLILLFCFLAWRAKYVGQPMKFFVLLTATLFGNGWLHLGQSAFLGLYTPGVLTAPLLMLFTALALRAFGREGFLTRRNLLPVLLGGFLLQFPLIVLVLALGRLFPI